MATGETGFDDVTFDLISVQYHSLKAGHDYGQYVRDAKNAGKNDIASFFDEIVAETALGRGSATTSSATSVAPTTPVLKTEADQTAALRQ